MLRGMRKASQGVVGKVVATVLFGILIISFAIWGIGDIFRATPQNVVARVGRRTSRSISSVSPSTTSSSGSTGSSAGA